MKRSERLHAVTEYLRRRRSGQDQHSKGLFTKLNPFVVTDSSAPSLIQNGQFQTNIAGWGDWRTNTQVKYVDNGGLDGGCLQFRLEGGPGANQAVASPDVALTKGQWYQLRFSVRAAQKGLLTVAARQDHIPYNTLNAPMIFPMGPERTNQECYLMADATDAQVRVEFRVTYPDSLFFLDNVTFRPVKGSYVSPESQAPVFVNSTSVTKTVDLGPDSFRDLDGNYLSGSIELPPYSSKILVREDSNQALCTNPDLWSSGSWNMISVPLSRMISEGRRCIRLASPKRLHIATGMSRKTPWRTVVVIGSNFPRHKTLRSQGVALSADTIPVTTGWNMIGSIGVPVPVSQIYIEPTRTDGLAVLYLRIWVLHGDEH